MTNDRRADRRLHVDGRRRGGLRGGPGNCGGQLQGVVVVSKDLEGELSVERDRPHGREGAAGLGAVGFAVGLFAPPLLAATAIGAALGAGAGKLLHHKTGRQDRASRRGRRSRSAAPA